MVAILYPRRLRNLLDVTQPQGSGLPDQGVPVLHSSNTSFVIQTIAGGGGGSFSLGASNLGNTLGQTGVTGSRVVLAGIGNLTLSQLTDANGGTISISAGTAAGAGFSGGVSGGNTAGDTGATGTRLVFAGGQSITLSQATDANGGTITISGASQSVQTQNRFNLTLSGNTAGALAQVSSGTLTLAGGNGVTLSQAGNAITISGITQSVQPETQTFIGGISASDTLYTSGSVRFTGSNIVTVRSGTGQLVVIDASTSQSVQTQNMVAVTLSGNTSGAQALISSGTMTLAGGNNITVSQNGNAVTISGPNVGGAQTGISGLANSQTTYTSGSVTFSALGALTIRSTTGQHFQFSVDPQSVQTQGQMSVGVSTGGNTAGDTGVTGTRMVFVGSNNITLSQATAAAGGTITISGPTTAAQTNQSGGVYAVGNTYSSSSGTYDARSLSIRGDGIISVAATNSGWRISASQSVQAETQTFVGGLAASNTTYTSGTITITGVGGGVTVSSNTGQRIDISVAAPVAQTGTQFSAGLSNIGNTAGDTGTVAGRLVLAGGNGITLSGSTNGVSETITVSGITQSVQTQGILSAGVSTGGNTAGNTQVSTGSRLVFAGAGMITASQATAAGASTISLSATQSVQTQGVVSLGVSTGGNTSGDTGVATGSRLVFVGGNNITLSQGTAAGASTITISAPNLGAGAMSAGVSNLGNTAGSTGVTGTRLVLVGTNNITLSQSTDANGGTVSISGGAGGGFSAGASTGGNTAGSTGITGTQLVFVGTNAISLSQSTGANGGTLSINAPVTSSMSGASGILVSTNGSTITVYQTNRSEYMPFSDAPIVTGQQGQGTLHIQPLYVPNVQHDRVLLGMQISNATNSSNSITISAWVGLYTKNASTISLLSSISATTNFSGSGTVGSYSLYGGPKWMSIPWTNTVTENDYYLGIIIRTTTGGGAGHTVSQLCVSRFTNSAWSGVLGVGSNATDQMVLGLGVYSATTSAMPNSIGFTQIQGSGTQVLRQPIFQLRSGTV